MGDLCFFIYPFGVVSFFTFNTKFWYFICRTVAFLGLPSWVPMGIQLFWLWNENFSQKGERRDKLQVSQVSNKYLTFGLRAHIPISRVTTLCLALSHVLFILNVETKLCRGTFTMVPWHSAQRDFFATLSMTTICHYDECRTLLFVMFNFVGICWLSWWILGEMAKKPVIDVFGKLTLWKSPSVTVGPLR